MTLWAAVVLVLALVGTTMNLILGTPFQLLLHDIILFLLALGILFRIRHQKKKGVEGTKQQGDEEPSGDDDSAQEEAEKEEETEKE